MRRRQKNSSRKSSSSGDRKPDRRKLASLRRLVPLSVLTLFPVIRVPKLWLMIWLGERPRAWDGTGHYGLAQIYTQSIFPDTFGWTHAYFGGMPYPNFYPPLFYWLVALLNHTGLFSFPTAFKIVLAASVLLIPAAVWALAWAVFDRNRWVATAAAFAVLPILIDYRFYHPVGINNASTFLIGLYTQPLGFVLLSAWLVLYLEAHRRRWRFALSCLLLALTILANFFNAITAALFIAATLLTDLVRYYRAADPEKRRELKTALLAHAFSPLIAVCLSLFWLTPMLSQYDYFVTRPHIVFIGQLVPPAMLGWYALAAAGVWCWLRRPTRGMWPFLLTCSALAVGVIFATAVAPRWFPLQSVRFLSTLNFLLAVPVGRLLLAGFQLLTGRLNHTFGRVPSRAGRDNAVRAEGKKVRYTINAGVALALLIAAFILIKPPLYTLSFLPREGYALVDGVLGFARQHRDGRYLVEVPNFDFGAAALDGRVLNSYLGAQGNETLSVVFREASPHALFFNPLVTAFSAFPDNFGVSSVLADDIDFVEQPLSRHIDRARFVGVKYLVIVSPEIKDRLAQEQGIGARYDLGMWSVFELRDEPPQRVRALAFRPALVVSNFSLKARRRNDYGFTRWAEEQFADGWFDVLLVRSPESKLDRLRDLDKFGSLILDTYEYDDEDLAFERLRTFAQQRVLILLSSGDALFQRIQQRLSDFPLATIVTRAPEEPGGWLQFEAATFRYNSSAIRREWQEIHNLLDQRKVAAGPSPPTLGGGSDQERIQVTPPASLVEDVPVLVGTTYHPRWRRDDGQTMYAATPFFMLTFVRQPVQIVYERYWYERASLWVSVIALILLCSSLIWHYRQRLVARMRTATQV